MPRTQPHRKFSARFLRLQHERPGWLIAASLFVLCIVLWLLVQLIVVLSAWQTTGNLTIALAIIAVMALMITASVALLGVHFGLEGHEKRSAARRYQRSIKSASSTERKDQ